MLQIHKIVIFSPLASGGLRKRRSVSDKPTTTSIQPAPYWGATPAQLAVNPYMSFNPYLSQSLVPYVDPTTAPSTYLYSGGYPASPYLGGYPASPYLGGYPASPYLGYPVNSPIGSYIPPLGGYPANPFIGGYPSLPSYPSASY